MINDLETLISDLEFKYSHESSNSAHFVSIINSADLKVFLLKVETQTLFNQFNESLSFTIGSHNPINFRSDEKTDDLIELLDLSFSDDTMLNIEFNINKNALEKLIKDYYKIRDKKVVIPLIFCTKHLIHNFKDSFVSIENEYLKKGYKTFFILFDVNNFYDNNDLILIMGTNFIHKIDFINEWVSGNEYSDLKISDKIDNRNINCHWVNSSKIITPDYFWFEKSFNMLVTNRFEYQFHIELYDLIDVLATRFMEIIFISIANYTDSDKIKIIGHKTIEFSRESISTKPITFTSLTTLKSIYNFIYFSQTLDKLILTRNALSLSSMNNQNFDFTVGIIEQSYNSIQNNYHYFVNNSVEEFIDKKLDLEKHARDTAKDLSDEISSGITLITRNLLTLIGATIIAYASSLLRVEKNLLLISAILYIIFVIVSSTFFLLYSHQKKNHSLEVYKHYSKINIYADNVSKEDFMKLIINPKIKSFNFYWKTSITLNLIFILLILIITYHLSIQM